MLITDVKQSFHCHSSALSRVNAARRRLQCGVKRPHTAGLHICRSRASTIHLQAWFKGCSPVGGLLDKGCCQSLHNFIVHCRWHPHKPRKGSWIFVTQLDHETVVRPKLRSPRNPVTHQLFSTTLLLLLLLLLLSRICCACISWFCWCWSMKKRTSRRSGFMFTP